MFEFNFTIIDKIDRIAKNARITPEIHSFMVAIQRR